MNRRVFRNGVAVLAICAAIVLLPARQTQAQECGPNCSLCMTYASAGYAQCMLSCPGTGDGSCPGNCLLHYDEIVQICAQLNG